MKEMLEEYWLMPAEDLTVLISDGVTQLLINMFIIVGVILIISAVVFAFVIYVLPFIRARWKKFKRYTTPRIWR